MPHMKFTPMGIKNLKPQKKPVEYFEQGRQKGEGSFGIRVQPSGGKTWFVMYWSPKDGKKRRFTLGTYPRVTLKEARIACDGAMVLVHKGIDPALERTDYRKAETFSDLWEFYLESPRAKQKSASTLRTEKRFAERFILPVLESMKIQDISRKDISLILSPIATETPIQANRIHALLTMLFNLAVDSGWIEYSPVPRKKPGGKENPRQRILSDGEIRTLWPHLPDYLKLILLTAQRPGEVLAMHSDEIDREKRIWIIPEQKTKTGNKKRVR